MLKRHQSNNIKYQKTSIEINVVQLDRLMIHTKRYNLYKKYSLRKIQTFHMPNWGSVKLIAIKSYLWKNQLLRQFPIEVKWSSNKGHKQWAEGEHILESRHFKVLWWFKHDPIKRFVHCLTRLQTQEGGTHIYKVIGCVTWIGKLFKLESMWRGQKTIRNICLD